MRTDEQFYPVIQFLTAKYLRYKLNLSLTIKIYPV